MAQLRFYRSILLGWLVCVTSARDILEFLQALDKIDQHEIVFPKITLQNIPRTKRSTREHVRHSIAIRDWTLKTRRNERLVVSSNFVSQWIHSGTFEREVEEKMPYNCEVLEGYVEGRESFVAVTVCESHVYGLVHVGNESFFIYPLTDGQHILYKSKTPVNWDSGLDEGVVSLKRKIGRNDEKTWRTQGTEDGEYLELPEAKRLDVRTERKDEGLRRRPRNIEGSVPLGSQIGMNDERSWRMQKAGDGRSLESSEKKHLNTEREMEKVNEKGDGEEGRGSREDVASMTRTIETKHTWETHQAQQGDHEFELSEVKNSAENSDIKLKLSKEMKDSEKSYGIILIKDAIETDIEDMQKRTDGGKQIESSEMKSLVEKSGIREKKRRRFEEDHSEGRRGSQNKASVSIAQKIETNQENTRRTRKAVITAKHSQLSAENKSYTVKGPESRTEVVYTEGRKGSREDDNVLSLMNTITIREKIDNSERDDGVNGKRVKEDFTTFMNRRFADMMAVTDNDADVYVKEAADMLTQFRDYVDDIWIHGNLNKSREEEISGRGLRHGAGPVGYENGRDLNVKLAKGTKDFGGGESASGNRKRAKRNLMICNTREFHNLTGDMIDKGNDEEEEEYEDEEGESEERKSGDMELRFEEDPEHIGYFFDRAWERDKLPKRKPLKKEAPPRWLELGIAADYSVVEFHGSRVQQYILAVLNIVSAIYKDPSLESNMKLVIVRMVFYAEKKDGMVREGNARRSLENVNRWNRRLLSSSGESHDVAIWLTRLDIGGPSGYAPVSGACDPARSCTLNRDEGLTSAFIIAHEVAHVLGLTHDGDENAGNTCGNEASLGSVMAPMVAATFHRFHWSTCSRKEFHHRAKYWSCLLNQPDGDNATHLKSTVQETFTMDEQCRMEFGDGYSLCRNIDLPEPCSHLWCGHQNSPQICRTKKGPPLEGTMCGEDKWCINGYCEPIDRGKFGLGPVVHNVRDGGWSVWGSWEKCSRSCGVGVQFRSRKCNKPTPAYGGADCKGKSEDYKICELVECPTPVDLRSQQCSRLVTLMGFEKTSPKYNLTWIAHEPDQESLKCQLSCRSKETGEVFFSGENLSDGTPCSYGGTDICIQGNCKKMGCNKILNSGKIADVCGECGGNNSNCNNITNKFERKLRRGMTRAAVIPRSAHNIIVNVTIVLTPDSYSNNITITIRDRRKKRNDMIRFDERGRGETLIVEGAAFHPQKRGDTYTVWAKGPVFSEIIVSLAVPDQAVHMGISVSVFSRYSIHRNDQNATNRYSWLPGGWGPCSSSCGGGTRQKTIACKDEDTGTIVPKRKCPLSSKPVQQSEKCNLFSCDFKWVLGPWEACTATCGKTGVQNRQLYCLHSSFNMSEVTDENAVEVYKNMVPPNLCKLPPRNERECNRFPCQGNWVFSDWSPCSQSCGRGAQSRMAHCVPPEGESFFECGPVTPIELRLCKGSARKSPKCERPCTRDESVHCSFQVLNRYCEIPGFNKRCCRSCRRNRTSD